MPSSGLLALGALAVALTLGTSVASAEITHKKIGEITEVNGHALVEPWGLTFDASGNLYVPEGSRELVYKLNSSNAFVTEIGVGQLQIETRHVAVDNATGMLYVGVDALEKVLVFKPVGAAYELVQEVSIEGYQVVAFDNSSGPDKGDLYVAGNRKVWKLTTNGEGLVGAGNKAESGETFPTLPAPEGFINFEVIGENGKGGIDLNQVNGKLYIAEPGRSRVTIYSPSGTYEGKIEGGATPGKSMTPMAVAVEGSTGDVYVYDRAHKVVDQFSSSGAYLGQFSEGITGEGTSGIAVQNAAGPSKNEIYVSDDTAGAVKINIYEATPTPKFKLTAEKTGTGSGTVTSTPAGINCGAECSHEFSEGEEVTLKASASGGSTFAGWSGACSGAGECKVTMTAAKTVKAEFTLNPPVNTGLPKAEGTAKEGHTLKANPGSWEGSPSSYAFVWEDCDSLGASCSTIATGEEYTLTSADVGHTVRVIVTAKNAGGTSAPATSEPTAVVIASGSEEASASSTVEGEVPKTTTLASTCEKVYLGEFKPGVEETYAQHCALTVTSTGAESSLTAADETGKDTGHLENGAYYLAKPLETMASGIAELGGASGTGGVLAPLTGPVTLLTYATPVSADEVTLQFSQKIGRHDPLHTGKYAKVITLTLKQTKP